MGYAKKTSQTIKELAEKNHISISKLAENIGIAQTTLNAALVSKKGVPVETLIKIADYFGMTVPQICGLEDIKKAPPPEDDTLTTEAQEVAAAYTKAEPREQQIVRFTLNLPNKK